MPSFYPLFQLLCHFTNLLAYQAIQSAILATCQYTGCIVFTALYSPQVLRILRRSNHTLFQHFYKGFLQYDILIKLFHLFHCLQGGRTAVHYGAMEGDKEMVELLIDRYSLSATDKDNVSLSCLRQADRPDHVIVFINRVERLL